MTIVVIIPMHHECLHVPICSLAVLTACSMDLAASDECCGGLTTRPITRTIQLPPLLGYPPKKYSTSEVESNFGFRGDYLHRDSSFVKAVPLCKCLPRICDA